MLQVSRCRNLWQFLAGSETLQKSSALQRRPHVSRTGDHGPWALAKLEKGSIAQLLNFTVALVFQLLSFPTESTSVEEANNWLFNPPWLQKASAAWVAWLAASVAAWLALLYASRWKFPKQKRKLQESEEVDCIPIQLFFHQSRNAFTCTCVICQCHRKSRLKKLLLVMLIAIWTHEHTHKPLH